MILRPYQQELYDTTRDAFREGNRRVCMQLPTGGGKTKIFSKITKSAHELGNRVWIFVPRNELLEQASDDLSDLDVNHGLIRPGHNESKAFRVHVVSKDTLIRRYEKIKDAPDLMIVDEAHLALERYKEIVGKLTELNENMRVIGVTATPERLDGRGLSEIYDVLVEGPSLQELIELGFLSPFRYFCPPLDGLDKIHRRGTEYKPDELADLLEKRKIYGDAIQHYQRHADGRPAIVYCRDLKSTKETAARFSDYGYKFENIDGTMPNKKRRALITGLKEGKIQGLTSCELITYGLDVPRVEVIVMLRPTLSRTLYLQMIGRGLRVWPEKKECIILDHVNNLIEHGHPLTPRPWNFTGTEKRKREKDNEANLRLCPELDYMYCSRPSCTSCPHGLLGDEIARRRKELMETEGSLKEVKAPVQWQNRPFEEKQQFVDRTNMLISEYQITGETGPIKELLDIAAALGRNPMWVYYKLSEGRVTVNVPLLHEIARIKGYKSGWAYFKAKALRGE